jgi:hypothetical protein
MAERINSFGMGLFKGVNHGIKPDEDSLLLNKLNNDSFILRLSNPIIIDLKYVSIDDDIKTLRFEDVTSINWWPRVDFCEIEYRSGRESVVIEILKADVLAIDEIIKPTPLTGKSRRVQ